LHPAWPFFPPPGPPPPPPGAGDFTARSPRKRTGTRPPRASPAWPHERNTSTPAGPGRAGPIRALLPAPDPARLSNPPLPPWCALRSRPHAALARQQPPPATPARSRRWRAPRDLLLEVEQQPWDVVPQFHLLARPEPDGGGHCHPSPFRLRMAFWKPALSRARSPIQQASPSRRADSVPYTLHGRTFSMALAEPTPPRPLLDACLRGLPHRPTRPAPPAEPSLPTCSALISYVFK
jgi:hypothetical protein